MNEPKTVSKETFGCLRFSLMILFAVAANVVAACLSVAFGFRFEGGWLSGLAIVYLTLSHVAADKILKWFGLSRSGVAVEVRSRSSWESQDDAPIGDVAEARISGGTKAFVLITTPIMGMFFLAAPLYLEEKHGVMRWLGPVMGVLFLTGFAYWLWDWNSPQARADAEGITGYPSHRAIRRVFVPWSDVLTCEIQTIYDTFGQATLLVPILRGHNGETLMRLNLLYTPMVEQDRIVKFIKSKLPKPQVDPWEL